MLGRKGKKGAQQMKVAIKNLGAVREAEIELKPLTVFVGPNNTGKTWTAYTIAAILGYYGWFEYKKAYETGTISHAYPVLDAAINQLVQEGNAKINLIQFFDDNFDNYVNNVSKLSAQWMRKFMDAGHAAFGDMEVQMNLRDAQQDILNGIRLIPLEEKLSVDEKGEALLNAVKEKNEPDIYFYTTGSIKDKLPLRTIKNFVAGYVFMFFHIALYHFAYYFPPERTAITWLVMSPGPKQDVNPIGMERRESIVSMAYPIENLIEIFDKTRNEGSQRDRLSQAKNDETISRYLELAELLQLKILGVSLDFSKPEPDLARELVFRPLTDTGDKKVDLDVSLVSSMVRELSPLVLYLRYIAVCRDLLVIDEPEMNLHPEAQAKLIEFISMLVNAGLNIIITTHSPYLVDHLINLMKAAEQEDPESISDKFFLKTADAFISKNDVSVYLFEKGTAKDIMNEDGFIDWETFGEVSDRIMQLRLEL